jgi:hypothetical protein
MDALVDTGVDYLAGGIREAVIRARVLAGPGLPECLLTFYLSQELVSEIAGWNRALFHEEQVKCLR